ncbi:carbon-nitrogen hydrolase family protein [Leucobacter luti]|uniref:carbon-nitrogen hydrolase family protein n=1 Tax=Leucobacter luti TaxID=340320 RepID=UPI001C6894BF|nr:carbon-nitrogen hydrolase family protein [Leucobacter luti]QYM74946.1 carbon-nitrogen hydrolase family protein [Leucobacter luti]
MAESLQISVGQFPALEDKAANLAAIATLAERAAVAGSRVLILPEMAMYHRVSAPIREGVAAAEELTGPFTTEIRRLSLEYGLFIAAGMSKRLPGEANPDRALNILLLVDRGEIVAEYEKIHLYDAFSVRESDSITPGNELPPVLDIDGIKVGFAICYDLRFPELFRLLIDQGAEVLALSAAWARGVMKEDHWLTLLRARAIENTAYVFASDEVSVKSVGRSAIYDPLGVQLGDAGEQDLALITATVDRSRLAAVRTTVPSLANRRVSVAPRVQPLPSGS